ncbi:MULTISPECIES: hypothetical protein [unclassified Bradyrhizobium]|uniref:hypothetical protein n=1 Tax=unclassified Bradyrhizobium TaxID=2631580 RepID=UPI0009395200|nr:MULTISPECIES: hypothetical protein [unclassified Bradyrhizobium]OKO72275.1 hypothetical protein AC630_31130 [Bradyrhizobium sp. AS23.2]OKO88845.1 hypothetical protein AC629_08240 [Bradyrhizobium sp. NAS80.1]
MNAIKQHATFRRFSKESSAATLHATDTKQQASLSLVAYREPGKELLMLFINSSERQSASVAAYY